MFNSIFFQTPFEVVMDKVELAKESIISKFKDVVKRHFENLEQKCNDPHALTNYEELNAFETEVHSLTRGLADSIVGIKLQENLSSEYIKKSGRDLVKSQGSRMKDMGLRVLKIRMLGGTVIELQASYYHRKSTLKKDKGKKGFYPSLFLLGITTGYSPNLESLISLLATASCSFDEASCLLQVTHGFSPSAKTISQIVKRYAARARSCIELGDMDPPDDFSGKVVAVSADGGRIRIRKNKRGKKTKKGRTRYKTDWKEPKLIIIYVVDEEGKRKRSELSLMDAILGGPDAIFSLLIFYLKKLKVNAADLLIFLSDGAKWIWDRAKTLPHDIGIASDRCLFALDYYHAVGHLSDLASEKKWDKKKKERWVNAQKKRLMLGELTKFMDEINLACKSSRNTKVKREKAYFKNHLDNMKYAELKAKGLPIGSGAVESGIRRVVNLRLKGPGIFWHKDSAEAMLMLRSYYKSGRWKNLENMACAGGITPC